MKTTRFQMRLSEEEKELFKKKSARYQTVSAMVMDAVKSFDDVQTQGKIEALTELKKYYIRFDERLGWLGGNINQAQKRANELAIAGKLTGSYIQQVLFPKIQEALQLIREMKSEQRKIYNKVLSL